MASKPEIRFLDRTTPPHIATLVLMAGIGALSMNLFLPSLPRMAEYFDTEYSIMMYSVTLYLGANAVLQLFVGPISDRYGRRNVTLGCIVVFLFATVGCIFAPTVEVFLAFRMLQSVISVSLVLSRAVVRDMFPQNEAASMIGYVTMGMALVPMVAPMIGGALDQVFGWQAAFMFMFACGVGIFALCWFDQGETYAGKASSLRDQFKDAPELFASRRFWGYVFAAAFAAGAFFSFLGGAPYVATEVYGLNSFWAGVGFGAPAIGYATGNFLSGRYAQRYGINALIFWGAIVTAVGMGLSLVVNLIGFSSPVLFFAFCTFVGIGNGLVMPNATAGLLSVRPALAGTASGLGSAILLGLGAALSNFA
ncbi:MAG: multidrug effflux MFS transporter, partial [Pseudomonadota bacterium]